MKNYLLKRIITYFIGNFSTKVISVILIPIYAFYVSDSDLGSYDYVLTLCNVIVPIAYINIWDAMLKYIMSADNKDEKKQLVSNGFAVGIFSCVFITTLYLTLEYLRIVNLDNQCFVICLLIMNGWCMFYQYLCRSFGENELYTKSAILGSVINFLGIIILVVILKKGLLGLMSSYVMSLLTIIIVIELNMKFISMFKYDMVQFRIIKNLLKFSFPLMINSVSLWLTSGISKVIVVNCISAEANGIYSFANRFSSIIIIFTSVVSMALLEEAYTYKTVHEYKVKFQKIIDLLVKYYYSILIVALPCISIVFFWFRKTDYYEALDIIPVFLLVTIFATLSTVVGIAFSVVGKTMYVFITSLVGGVVNIGLGLMLVDRWSYFGVVIAQLAGNIVMFCVRSIVSTYYTKVRPPYLKILLLTFISIMIGCVTVNISTVMNFVLFVFLSILMCIWNRKDLLLIFKRGKKIQ